MPSPAHFVILRTAAGRYYFALQDATGERVMTSESYLDKLDARRAIEGAIVDIRRAAWIDDATGDGDETGVQPQAMPAEA